MEKTQARNRAWNGIKGIVEKAKNNIDGGLVELHLSDKTSKGKISTSRKRNLIAERGGICENCGKDFKEWVFEVHHIIPREYNECTDDKENLMVLCANCHREFSHKWDELRRHAKKDSIEATRKQLIELASYIVE